MPLPIESLFSNSKRDGSKADKAIAKFMKGTLTERGIARCFANQWHPVHSGVAVLDLPDGNFSEAVLSDSAACLVIFEAQKARSAGIQALLINRVSMALGPDTRNRHTRIAEVFGPNTGHVGGPVAQVIK